MIIRTANKEDADAVSSLVLDTASSYIRNEFTDDGWKLFQRLFCKDSQRELINNDKFHYMLAENETKSRNNNEIVGILAIREHSHIFHFFVSSTWQNKGVGRLLWRHYLQNIGSGLTTDKMFNKVTVNASDFGKQFYLKLGFTIAGARQMKNGVYFTPLFFLL